MKYYTFQIKLAKITVEINLIWFKGNKHIQLFELIFITKGRRKILNMKKPLRKTDTEAAIPMH